jgi:hypothetical protein
MTFSKASHPVPEDLVRLPATKIKFRLQIGSGVKHISRSGFPETIEVGQIHVSGEGWWGVVIHKTIMVTLWVTGKL